MKAEEAIKYLQQLYPNGGHCWLDEQRIEAIGMAVKALQGEPISSIWHDASEKSNEPEDIVIINSSDNTGEVLTKCTGVYQGRIWAYTSVLLKLDNPCKIGKNLQEEPISNDIEAEFVLYLKHKFNIPQEGNKLKTNGWRPSPYDILDIAKHFAQWQKEQMAKEVDLEKELIIWHRLHFKKGGTFEKYGGFYLANSSQLDLAKHFFELGLKAQQKGE